MYIRHLYLLIIIGLLICQNTLGETGDVEEKSIKTPKNDIKQSESVVKTVPSTKGHILFFHNQGTRSHLIAMSALASALLGNGYTVTTVFYAKSNIVHENYNEILIEDKMVEVYNNFSKVLMETGGSLTNMNLWYEGIKIWHSLASYCKDSLLENPKLVKMMEDKVKIDAVVALSSCGYFLSHAFDTQLIPFCPAGPLSIQLKPGLGNPINPMVQPHIMSQFLEPMTFFQRLGNHVLELILDIFVMYIDSLQMRHVREHFGEDIPDFYDIAKERSALTIVNSHFVTHGSWPTYPNMIEVGGIHCKPGKELPIGLKTYMDSHPEGVVYVSFGSALKPSQMTSDQKNVFIDTFRELKNIPIIWKWDDIPDGIPENVLIQKWLPQNDLLAHPNLKVFVTHGGLLSTQEALFHQVPLVGVPISNDQIPNMLRAEAHGYAKMLDLQTMTKEDLKSAIEKAINDKNMHQSMKKMHDLFTDHSFGGSPDKKAVSAIDLVVKHKGADFLKPKGVLSMSWYQEHGYDILIFVLIIMALFCWLTFKFCHCCLGRCFRKKTKQD